MASEFTTTDRRLGLAAAVVTMVLLVSYAAALAAGFASLASPEDPISDPWFTALEVLILALMPAMVALMVAVHAWVPAPTKALTLTAVVFMSLVAGVTSVVHFAILTLSQQPAFAEASWAPLLFSFEWPSVAYALDILAWDVLFPLSMLFAAPAFGGSRLAVWIRWLMIVSGALAFAGLAGIATGNMQLRNVGIVGYVGVFLVVAVLLAILFYRFKPQDPNPPSAGLRTPS